VLVPSTPAVRSDLVLIVTVGRAWNTIPVGIRRSCILGSFNKQLKKFLLKRIKLKQITLLISYLYGLIIYI